MDDAKKKEAILLGLFMIALIIWTVILALFMPETNLFYGTQYHLFFKYFWWSASIFAFAILLITAPLKSFGEFLGCLIGGVLGPATLTTLVFVYLYAQRLKRIGENIS